MLDAVKEALTKEVDLKKVLNKEIDLKEIMEMEIEIRKLKELLATEVKIKEFLLKEIDIKDVLPQKDKEEQHTAESSSETSAQQKDVPEKEVKKLLPAYDYGLIEAMKNDHEEITFIYDELMKYARLKKYQLVTELLEKFSSRIRKHYYQADIDLYAYLKRFIQLRYPKREKAFTELSLEMKNISISIFYSISQSPNIPLRDETFDGFINEFENLGEQLKARIEREQKVLFRMYEDSRAATDIS